MKGKGYHARNVCFGSCGICWARATDLLLSKSVRSYDTVWGIGVTAFDPATADTRRWSGQNLLGQALQKVRDLLKEQSLESPGVRLPQGAPQPANGDIFEANLVKQERLPAPGPASTPESSGATGWPSDAPDDRGGVVLAISETLKLYTDQHQLARV